MKQIILADLCNFVQWFFFKRVFLAPTMFLFIYKSFSNWNFFKVAFFSPCVCPSKLGYIKIWLFYQILKPTVQFQFLASIYDHNHEAERGYCIFILHFCQQKIFLDWLSMALLCYLLKGGWRELVQSTQDLCLFLRVLLVKLVKWRFFIFFLFPT